MDLNPILRRGDLYTHKQTPGQYLHTGKTTRGHSNKAAIAKPRDGPQEPTLSTP